MSLRFSFLRGFCGPSYLAVTCPMLFLPEEYITWFTLADHFWRDSVFSAYWFDNGYLVLPVYGGFVRMSFFHVVYSDPAFDSRPALRLFSVCREEYKKSRVDNGSCMLWAGLLVSTHFALCFLLFVLGP